MLEPLIHIECSQGGKEGDLFFYEFPGNDDIEITSWKARANGIFAKVGDNLKLNE